MVKDNDDASERLRFGTIQEVS